MTDKELAQQFTQQLQHLKSVGMLDDPELFEWISKQLDSFPFRYSQKVHLLMFAITQMSEKDRSLFFRAGSYTEPCTLRGCKVAEPKPAVNGEPAPRPTRR